MARHYLRFRLSQIDGGVEKVLFLTDINAPPSCSSAFGKDFNANQSTDDVVEEAEVVEDKENSTENGSIGDSMNTVKNSVRCTEVGMKVGIKPRFSKITSTASTTTSESAAQKTSKPHSAKKNRLLQHLLEQRIQNVRSHAPPRKPQPLQPRLRSLLTQKRRTFIPEKPFLH